MRLSRMGSAHQTRLSFMRSLLRDMRREGWRFDRPLWEIGADGTGRAVYRATGPRHVYSLVAFAHDLPDDLRSDRVIATAWDATFALVDGTPGAADLDRLEANVPLQEAGRVSDRELVLSRANRSTRAWDHVVTRLGAGRQPDPALLDEVGYLMRTTAVYGSGKFGAADRAVLARRPLMGHPFRAEMLAVWLIRAFCLDLVEHLARAHGGQRAVRLDPALRRRLGIGNSTGLGMAPFLVNHPALLHGWVAAREEALARVRRLPRCDEGVLRPAFERAQAGVAGWRSEHPLQKRRLAALGADIDRLGRRLDAGLGGYRPLDALWRWGEGALTEEGQELLLSVLLEPHGAIVDDLAATMGADEEAAFGVDASWSVARLRRALDAAFGWAAGIDFRAPEATDRFWYVSENKLEPRMGQRHEEPGGERESPLDIARRAQRLAGLLDPYSDDADLCRLLADHPEVRLVVRRLQICADRPYAEIRDNLIGAQTLPIDMLRFKLSFFGATRFDPRSDRWVRITMFQDAPFPDELHDLPEDDWALPSRAAMPAGAA